MGRSAVDVDAFYAQPVAELDPATEEPILVAQADGKGVPMITTASEQPVRLGKGQKRVTKKEAIVTCRYTVVPYVRTPDEVADAIRSRPGTPASPTRRQGIARDLGR